VGIGVHSLPTDLTAVAHEGLVALPELAALDDDFAVGLVAVEFFEGHAVPRFSHLSMMMPKSGGCFALIGRFRVLTSTFAAAVSQ
jgi:hypothetical protein